MDKEFKKIMIFLFKSMDANLKKIEENTSNEYIDIEYQEEAIMIPKKVYKEICEIIESDHIDFMGIS